MTAPDTDLLAPAGPLARVLGSAGPARDAHGFEVRPQQRRMADAVARALDARSTLLVEAGTGVGKSFAYLIPALQRILTHHERVVVATHTIALQEQLLEKDVPTLRAALAAARPDASFKAVLVKGRGNYVSIRRLKLASERQDRLFPDAASKRSLHVIEDWAYSTTDGTLSTLPPLERPAVWERAESDSGNCMGRRCPTYEQCFYQRARRDMESADLLICNHALFFADLAMRAAGVGFLPAYDHVILDEAHNVEDVAAEHFGLSLAEGRVQRLLTTLFHQRTGKGFLPGLTLKDGETAPVDQAIHAVMRAETDCRGFFESLLLAAGGAETARLPAPGAVVNTVSPALGDLALRLRRLKERAAREDDAFELNALAERAAVIADEAAALIDQTVEGCVYWVEAPRRAHGVRITLACAPVDVSPLLRERLFNGERSVVLASATLATRGAPPDAPAPANPARPDIVPDDAPPPPPRPASDPFAHARARLGCADAETLLLDSPYDYARQVRLMIDRSMPDPRDPAYMPRLVDAIVHHALETDGGAFILCTSFDTLRRAAEGARAALEAAGILVLAQSPAGAAADATGSTGPRGVILQRFREHGRAALFGTSSFWQGVDVRGEALRNVIITRLPFEPPDRPLTQARLDRVAQRGGDPFFEDSLPRAVLRFKQGFGRLIRSATDAGRVVVLDPRIVTKPYGRSFLHALPAGVRPEVLRAAHPGGAPGVS